MPIQSHVSFLNMPESAAIKNQIDEKISNLETVFPRIMGCHVVVNAPHRHHQKGKLYQVRIDMTLPGGELVVNRSPSKHAAHRDARIAIRDAFNAARRRLQDYFREIRGEVKQHDRPPVGRVTHVSQDFGFLQSLDGRQIYFHKNSVLNDAFKKMLTGTKVRFVEESGQDGPQASTVRIME